VRVFTTAGRFIRTIGARGDGPAEFAEVGWVDRCGSTPIVVYDRSRYRITMWDRAGTLLDGFNVEGPRHDLPPYAVSCGPDGTFAVMSWPDVMGRPPTTGPYRPDVVVGIAGPDGRIETILGTFPGPERYRYPTNDGPRRLGRATVVRMGRGEVYVGTADSIGILVVGADGARRRIPLPYRERPLTPRMRDRYEESIVERTDERMRPGARRALDALVMPELLPTYSDLLVDRLGFVWVAPYRLAGVDEGDWGTWDVLDPSGRPAAVIQVPTSFRPTEIGRDYVLGVHVDAMGVERVHRYTLTR
jgi:hypothetical protein